MLGVGPFGPRGPEAQPVGGGRDAHSLRTRPGAPFRSSEVETLAEERQAWVVLATVDGVGERTLAHLVATHGTARRVLWLAARGRLGRGLASEPERRRGVLAAATLAGIEAAAQDPGARLAALAAAAVWTVTLLDADYPARLQTLLVPPPVLFGQGDPRALDAPRAVAIVGTRRASPAGRFEASRAAAGLAARGVTVVSGLAIGIDGAAHAAALEAGGTTLAAIGAGHARPGPAAHRALVRRILERGAVIGELPPAARASRGTYPRRNRLIVALADAVLVVEAPARSGALITAHLAMEQGVPLYVVPGRATSELSAGCRALLDEGSGHAFGGARELCRELGWEDTSVDVGQSGGGAVVDPAGCLTCDPAAAVFSSDAARDGFAGLTGTGPGAACRVAAGGPRHDAAVLPALSMPEREVARIVARGPITMDQLLDATRASPGELAATLTLLQLRGLVRSMGPLYLPAGRLLLTAP